MANHLSTKKTHTTSLSKGRQDFYVCFTNEKRNRNLGFIVLFHVLKGLKKIIS